MQIFHTLGVARLNDSVANIYDANDSPNVTINVEFEFNDL